MQLNQGAFIQALADSKVMGTLESLALKNPKSEKEYEKVFGEKPEAKHTKRFFILMMECINVWGNKFQDQKGISQKYTTVLNNLIKKKIPIPEKFYYFPDKDNAKQAPTQLIPIIAFKLQHNWQILIKLLLLVKGEVSNNRFSLSSNCLKNMKK